MYLLREKTDNKEHFKEKSKNHHKLTTPNSYQCVLMSANLYHSQCILSYNLLFKLYNVSRTLFHTNLNPF